MKKPKPVATKATIFLNNETQSDNFPSRSEAISWVMSQFGLKPHCGHALCLDHHNYVNLPGSKGWAKIINL